MLDETEEHGLLRETVRKTGRSLGPDHFVHASSSGIGSRTIWSALARVGLTGVNTPAEHGGAGLGLRELAIVTEEMASEGCPALTLIVTPAICASILARHGSPEQKGSFLPELASGAATMAFAITEPDAGSNSHRISTVATKDGGAYRLRGSKTFISGVDEARWVLVVAKTGERGPERGALSLFVVDTNAAGLEKRPIPMEITAPEKQFSLFFDDVVVPEARLVGAEGDGLRVVFAGLNPERIIAAATSCGIGLYALRKAARYATERSVWGVPIATHQAVAHPLAQAKIHIELARLMTMRAASLYDAGHDAGETANMAKFAAADASLEALDASIQAHGGNGLASEFRLMSFWGLARLLRTAPVSREMILNFVAQHSLHLPKSY